MENANEVTERPFPGTVSISEMTDRELLEECVYHMRTVGAVLAEFQKMGPGGILKMMMGK